MNVLLKKCQKGIRQGMNGRLQFVAVAAGLAVLVMWGAWQPPATAWAQDDSYTEASLQGDYGRVGAYSGDVARLLGTLQLDGKGRLTGSSRIVIVGGTVRSTSVAGHYTINPDGTGTMTSRVYGAGTPPPTVVWVFVITKARFIHGIKVATEIQAAQVGPSVVVPSENSFVTYTFTRRPDRDEDR